MAEWGAKWLARVHTPSPKRCNTVFRSQIYMEKEQYIAEIMKKYAVAIEAAQAEESSLADALQLKRQQLADLLATRDKEVEEISRYCDAKVIVDTFSTDKLNEYNKK
jgi:GAF domain-containing protein